MDHIKSALERAKVENNHAISGVYEENEVTGTLSDDGQEIKYTQTRIIDVPKDILKENRIIAGIGPGYIIDAYRMLRTKILQQMNENHWNTMAVTSATPGSGKTLTAINLAISIAMEVNQTVLLVDFDLRRPSLHKYFGFVPEKGLSDYILNNEPLNELMINPGIERLVLLPGNEPIVNSSEVLSSPKMKQLVEELKARYPSRLIVFDLPPLLSTDDALAFSPYVDALLMVVEDGKTRSYDLKQAVEMLKGFPLLGTVMNKSQEKPMGYY